MFDDFFKFFHDTDYSFGYQVDPTISTADGTSAQ